MSKLPLIILFSFFLLLLTNCTTSQKVADEEKIYVFDEQNDDGKIEVKKDGEYPSISETYFVVQIGAFTTKERAEKFAESSRLILNKEIVITYSENNNLYLVQISPFYKSRQEAELIRDELKTIPEFSDVWIVTVNK